MKQLRTVFKFEFLNYAKAKSFVVTTLILMLVVVGVLSWPRISALFAGGGSSGDAGEAGSVQQVLMADMTGDAGDAAAYYAPALQAMGYQLLPVEDAPGRALAEVQADLSIDVDSGAYDSAVILTGPLGYTRIVRNTSMYDAFGAAFEELMLTRYRAETLAALGVPADEIASYVSAAVVGETITTSAGKDGAMNFLYTYILIMMLYMTVVLYGNMVASSVATEKSTRAMELLITSARPTSLMFGKVLGAGIAGLAQFVLILGTAFAAYNFNAAYFAGNALVQSIFAMPLSLMLYTFLFFILGFFIYAFLYASMASLVSRMEDLSQAIQPVIFVLIAAFMVVIFSISSGTVDNAAMVFCSFFPLTSPMAMFARIAMGEVPGWQVAVSVGLLVVSTIGVGYFAAALYRLGVLLYGNPPKPAEIVRMLRNASRSRKAQQAPEA